MELENSTSQHDIVTEAEKEIGSDFFIQDIEPLKKVTGGDAIYTQDDVCDFSNFSIQDVEVLKKVTGGDAVSFSCTRNDVYDAFIGCLDKLDSTPPKPEVGLYSSNPYPNKGKRWGPEQQQTLLDMYYKGSDVNKISAALGRTPLGIACRLVTVGIVPTIESARGFSGNIPDRLVGFTGVKQKQNVQPKTEKLDDAHTENGQEVWH